MSLLTIHREVCDQPDAMHIIRGFFDSFEEVPARELCARTFQVTRAGEIPEDDRVIELRVCKKYSGDWSNEYDISYRYI